MNRRSFIQAGALGLSSLGVGIPNVFGSADKSHNKSVIFIFLAGGMSHAESFNAAPDSIDRYKSVTGYIRTKTGNYLAGNWDKMAAIDDLYTNIHSFGHINPAHQGGTVFVNTGYNFTDENPGAQQTHPSYGSVVSKVYGPNLKTTGLPTYVSTNRLTGQYSAYLGGINNPFTIDEQGKKNLSINIEVDRFNQRYQTLQQLDNKFSSINQLKIVDDHKKQAFDIMFGQSAQAFDISKENLDQYGNTQIGKDLVLARKLVENGSRFVTVVHGGWDMHSNIKQGMDNLVPQVDTAIAGLLLDLKNRGLLESTLVVISTEFGRTPINADSGRDHYPSVVPLILSGGKYSTGNVIGKLDKNGFEIKDSHYYPINLLCTIMNHMEIPVNSQFTDFSGRPRYILEGQDKRIIS